MWTQVLVSFFKLLEVGFLPTWVLFLFLSVLSMFRLFEAVRGRLISPKTWDRIDKIFGRKMEQPVAAPQLIWVHNDGFVLICALVVCFVYNGPGMALDFGFTK